MIYSLTLDRAAEAGATQERALEDQEPGDRDEARDEHGSEEDAELRLRLDGRKANRERLLVRVGEDEQRPEEVLPRREHREHRDDPEDGLRHRQDDPDEQRKRAGAVDPRRLEDLSRQVVE